MPPLLRPRALRHRHSRLPGLFNGLLLGGALLAHAACSPLDDDTEFDASLMGAPPTHTVAALVPPPPPKPVIPASLSASQTSTAVTVPVQPSASTPRPTWTVVPLITPEHQGTSGNTELAVSQTTASTTGIAPQRALRSVPAASESALPAVPSTLPTSPEAQAALLTRPPISPPIAPLTPPTVSSKDRDKESARRCVEAVNAARTVVTRPLGLPVEQLKNADWKEEALRATELAQIACRGETGEQAAQYWRATAFVLHGQYARAALNYRRVIELPGSYANWGYVQGLASMLDTCARADRDALDAWTLGGLLEARGAGSDARLLYRRSVEARCQPLRTWSKARMALVDG
mgnify:CR=1 FL=1